MANLPLLTLDSVSHVLPDGTTLFSSLTESFDTRPTGLVGRNGVGKSVLARLLSGAEVLSSGRISRIGTVRLLSQQVAVPDAGTVAELAGVRSALEALDRIEAGGVRPEDFDLVGDRWDLRVRLQAALAMHGLAHLSPQMPARQLSGGEAMRMALIGAFLSGADFLILDEPSNHLDRHSRRALIEQLHQWRGGLLVISHDRELLASLDRIVELRPSGLHSYGGGYDFYAECRAREHEQARQQVAHVKLERQRKERELLQQQARQARRQARGQQHGREANQAKILLDRQKERSEQSLGRLRVQHEAIRQVLDERVSAAVAQVDKTDAIKLHGQGLDAGAASRVVAVLEDVELPFGSGAGTRLNLTFTGRQRVGLTGPNGCGKSTLLQVLAGTLAPRAGRRDIRVPWASLDQHLAASDPQRSALERLQDVHPRAGEALARTRLAHLGLDTQRIHVPTGQLSGGERLKVELACAVYADPPAQLLLLDEPSNHLDLASVEALERLLTQYEGAFVIASHDEALLSRLKLTHRLDAAVEGWSWREV